MSEGTSALGERKTEVSLEARHSLGGVGRKGETGGPSRGMAVPSCGAGTVRGWVAGGGTDKGGYSRLLPLTCVGGGAEEIGSRRSPQIARKKSGEHLVQPLLGAVQSPRWPSLCGRWARRISKTAQASVSLSVKWRQHVAQGLAYKRDAINGGHQWQQR